MKKPQIIMLALLALAPMTGCLSGNRILGNRIVRASHWYGELGITGHLNEITVQTGSNLTKLSIIGNYNTIRVEEHVRLGKIEIWGQENKVYVPQDLVLRDNVVGHGSEIIRVAPGEGTPPPVGETFVPEPAPEEVHFEPAEERADEAAEPLEEGEPPQ